MAVTLTTRALTTDLTTVANVQERLKLGAGVEEPLLGRLIRGATAAILQHCNREFARVQVTETVKGYGGTALMLTRTPILTLGTVLNDGSPVTDFALDDPKAGLIYRQLGADWTRQFGVAELGGWDTGQGLTTYPVPGSEAALYSVAYWAGYLLPGDDVLSTGLSAAVTTNTYALASGTMPLVIAGDVITVDGFTTAANNGLKTVVSRTASTIVVSETLATDAAEPNQARGIAVRTLPADVEEAAIQTVVAWYTARGRDPQVQSRTIGDLSVTYRDPAEIEGESSGALPYTAVSGLIRYVRVR